ncbi:MAG TPA: 50S ribosomal protein L27 [Patescibacteria group bacterium]|nr:50S ribosomal protein L27 [Patescibacteria group bacterium]
MAKTKTGKTTKGSRQPRPKYLGVKRSGGERVTNGTILIRQRGTHYHPGPGVDLGSDCTIYATREGMVRFYERKGRKFVSVAVAA